MITKNTVLVLGAGASKPYGYPLGSELRAILANPQLFAPAVDANWISEYDVQQFCDAFLYSGMKSIDAFLSRRGKDVLPS